jgi:Rrf2 family transcriptional regulator, iron-sulfur cluster assembly transcription factor
MLLSKSCEYGIRATLYLAKLKSNGYVSIREISEELDISFHFLTKIFQKLTQAGILASFRGPNGGVALARAAKDVRLLDIVIAIDGRSLFQECILGLPGCGNRTPCPLHSSWAVERERLQDMFSRMTLAATAEELRSLGLRLSASPATP